MSKKFKIIGGLSKKAKVNIFIVIFLIFIVVTVIFSVNQIKSIVEKRKRIVELEEKLTWLRNKNIELLAKEKSLYSEDAIESEARKQFSMADKDDTTFYVVVEKNTTGETDVDSSIENNVYSNTNLWENIKILYNKEIKYR